MNAIYVAKHHLWHQSWRNSWLWHLGLRTLNYSLVNDIFGGKSFYFYGGKYSFPHWGRYLSLHCQFFVSLGSILFQISTKRYHNMTLDWITSWGFCFSLLWVTCVSIFFFFWVKAVLKKREYGPKYTQNNFITGVRAINEFCLKSRYDGFKLRFKFCIFVHMCMKYAFVVYLIASGWT